MRPLFLAMMLCVSVASQAESTLPANERTHLEDPNRFHMVSVRTPLPSDIRKLCADHNGLLAGPGERWNAIDVMVVGLPTRRLVWASQSDELLVVHYEQGGFFHSFHIAVARAKANAAGYELLWRAEGPRLRDHSDLVRALRANAFRTEPL